MNTSASTNKLSIDHDSILIVDKEGVVGNSISNKLSESALTKKIIVVSKKKEISNSSNLLFVSYNKKIPSIPQNTYSLIFLVFNGEKELLSTFSQFEERIDRQSGKIVFIIPLEYASEELIKKLSLRKNVFIAVIGDYFDKDFLKTEQKIGHFFVLAKKGEKIELPGIGLGKIFPVLLDDVISCILDIALKPQKAKVFNLFPKNPPTELSFMRILRKIHPSVKIDFSKQDKAEKENYVFLEGEHMLGDKYLLEQKIKDTFEHFQFDKQHEKLVKRQNKTNPSFLYRKSSLKRKSAGLLLFIFALFFMPMIASLFFAFIGAYELKSIKNEFEKGDFAQVKKKAYFASDFFAYADKTNQIFMIETKFLGNSQILGQTEISRNIKLGKAVSLIAVNLSDAYEKLAVSKINDFASSLNSIKSAIAQSAQIETEIGEQGNEFLSKELLKNKEMENLLKFLTSTINILPEILGFEGEKKYLILFQNNMELRPGGGFIGSYAVLTLNQGKVKSLLINDVYDADGQLKGHVEPPFAIRRHMPLVHWYLRDSNFDVDFTKSASMSAFFLSQEKGETVDGVIGVDVSFVKNLLLAMGPVKVVDYNETVTADNLYLLTQKYVEKNTFAGSTQKKDFLKSLLQSIQLQLLTGDKIPYLELGKVMRNSLSQKHLLFAFSNPYVQSAFTVNGMSSSLWDNRKNTFGEVNDFLGVNEANLGVNKANYFIKRKISQEVVIDEEGNITEKLIVYIRNNSKNWPGGDYKNYLRLILPDGAKISSIAIDGEEQKTIKAITDPLIYEKKNFKAPKELEIEETKEDGKSIFGFLVVVPSEKLKKITVSYSISQKLDLNSLSSFYSHKIFKQPGTEDDIYSFSLSFPQTLKVHSLPEEFKNDDSKISWLTKLLSDIDFKIAFSKK